MGQPMDAAIASQDAGLLRLDRADARRAAVTYRLVAGRLPHAGEARTAPRITLSQTGIRFDTNGGAKCGAYP